MYKHLLQSDASYLYDVLAQVLGQRCAIQEAVVIRVALCEAQPAWQVWELLLVALEHHGVIIHTPWFHKERWCYRDIDSKTCQMEICYRFNINI